MAEEEEYEFTPPDFDEDAFIHKEMVSFRATVVLFLWGIILSAATWGIFLFMDGAMTSWYLSLALVAAGGYGLKFILPRLGMDISHYQRREWLGTGFLFFFTWLAFAILLVNPPVSDFTDPTVDVYVSPSHQMLGADITIDVFFADNDKLDDLNFMIMRGGETQATIDDATKVTSGHYRFNAAAWPAGTYTIMAVGTDAKGHETSVEQTFQVRGPNNALAVKAILPDALTTGEFIIVQVPQDLDVYAVYADIDGRDARVYFEEDETVGGWKASNIFAGWINGNNTFNLVVEETNHFQGVTLVPGGKVVLGPYSIDVDGASGAYDKSIPKPQSTVAPSRQVPSLGVGVLALGVLAVALVIRSKRD